jgi:hypothetical protein
MRILSGLLATGLLLLTGSGVSAQLDSQGRQAQAAPAIGTGGSAPSLGVNSNRNTLSTGSNTNINANSNSQFLSGSNTGVNNGSLEVYSGSDPYQGIILEGSVNLPQLPGFMPPTNNFSQPYRPDTFVNVPAFLPAEMTLAEAKACRDSKVSWYGGSREKSTSIKLFYVSKQESPTVAMAMASYVGTAMAQASDGPFIAALCEAAYRAMRNGATVGVVDYSVRPKNTMSGIGYGASGGATGLPAAGTHPYAIAGTLGFGTGWSNQRVEGEVVLQLTALRETSKPSAADVVPPSPPVRPTIPRRGGEAPAPAVPDSAGGESRNGSLSVSASPILLTSSEGGLHSGLGVNGSPPQSPHTEDEPKPEATPPTIDRPGTSRAGQNPGTQGREDDIGGGPGTSSVHSGAGPPWRSVTDKPASSSRPLHPVTYHSPKKLEGIRSGTPKERVFDKFGTVFVKQGGKIVKVDGMRLRSSGQSERSTRIEVSEVTLAEPDGLETPYWFLFEDGRLLAWGRPDQWRSTAARYRVDLAYRSAPGVGGSPDAASEPGR